MAFDIFCFRHRFWKYVPSTEVQTPLVSRKVWITDRLKLDLNKLRDLLNESLSKTFALYHNLTSSSIFCLKIMLKPFNSYTFYWKFANIAVTDQFCPTCRYWERTLLPFNQIFDSVHLLSLLKLCYRLRIIRIISFLFSPNDLTVIILIASSAPASFCSN